MTNKSWRRPFSPKDSVVRSAAEMVSRPWFENHSGSDVACRGVQTFGQQLVWQADRSSGAADDREVHKSEGALGKDLRSVWFKDLEESGDEYEIEMKMRQVEIDSPFQVGIAVYQMAKLRVLHFYCACLDKFVDRRYELIQMDTDSL